MLKASNLMGSAPTRFCVNSSVSFVAVLLRSYVDRPGHHALQQLADPRSVFLPAPDFAQHTRGIPAVRTQARTAVRILHRP
jgi:hypothetical protein